MFTVPPKNKDKSFTPSEAEFFPILTNPDQKHGALGVRRAGIVSNAASVMAVLGRSGMYDAPQVTATVLGVSEVAYSNVIEGVLAAEAYANSAEDARVEAGLKAIGYTETNPSQDQRALEARAIILDGTRSKNENFPNIYGTEDAGITA